MLTCPHCAKENPDHLVRCVDCGGALRHGGIPGGAKLLAIILSILGLVLAGTVIWRWPALQARARARSAADPATEAAARRPMEYAVFETKGRAEFQGVAISFEYPAGWTMETRASKDDEPAIVFLAPGSRRDLLAAAISAPVDAPQAEFTRVLRDPAAQQGLIPGARNFHAEEVKGLAFTSYLLTYELAGTPTLAGQCRNYVFFVDGHVFHLNFMRMGPPGSTTIDEWAELIQHVARSVKRG